MKIEIYTYTMTHDFDEIVSNLHCIFRKLDLELAVIFDCNDQLMADQPRMLI